MAYATGEDVEGIQKQIQELEQLTQQLGASMYQQPGGEGRQAGPTAWIWWPGGDSGPADDDVVDGEFKSCLTLIYVNAERNFPLCNSS